MFSFRVDRDSERNPRSLLRGKRANQKIDSIPLGEDSLSAIALWRTAGYASITEVHLVHYYEQSELVEITILKTFVKKKTLISYDISR
jgi:hypothetical protein